MSSNTISTLTVATRIPEAALAKVRAIFETVHYYPDPSKTIPDDVLQSTDIIFTRGRCLPECIVDLERQLPRLRHLQLLSAGSDKFLTSPAIVNYLKQDEGRQLPFTIGNASGVHAVSIAQYIVGCVLSFTNHLVKQIVIAQTEARWAEAKEIAGDNQFDPKTSPNSSALFNFSLRGKTVGMLGYGHIAREAARLLHAFGCTIIAANTSGTARRDDGYVIPGTGDVESKIPARYYTTTDSASLDSFLSECDILVASLPSTKETQYLLDARSLGRLQKDAIFVNVGRGNLIRSDDILKALEPTNGLLGVAIDVTDPEPLPNGHALFTHPRVIVTPHTSGDSEDEYNLAIDILVENVNRLREGKKIINQVDVGRRY